MAVRERPGSARPEADGGTGEADPPLGLNHHKRLAPFQGRAFVSLRPLWGQMAERYGLREIAPINVTPQTLTDDDVRALKQAAKEAETDLLVTDATFLPGIQRELQLRTGLR